MRKGPELAKRVMARKRLRDDVSIPSADWLFNVLGDFGGTVELWCEEVLHG